MALRKIGFYSNPLYYKVICELTEVNVPVAAPC